MKLVPLSSDPRDVEAFLDMVEPYWAELAAVDSMPEPFDRTQYRGYLQRRDQQRFCWLEEDGKRAGFCVFTLSNHWYRGDVREGYVDEFFILPAARRNGAGRRAAEAILQVCREEGCRAVQLSVLKGNAPAQAFWKGLGFQPRLDRMALALDPEAEPPQPWTSFTTAVHAHLEAIQRRDLETYAASLSDGPLTLVMPNGKLLRGREAILEFHRDWFADRDWIWTPRSVETHEGPGAGTALCDVLYRDVDRSGQPTEQQLWVTLSFVREGGLWRLVHDQNTAQR